MKMKLKSTSYGLPLVSVIMPAYNAENYIAEAIKSIINQSYNKWELIIVDDASTDKTWNIIKQFTNKFPKKIKATRLKKNVNRGGDGAGNIAFTKTNPKSEFIARMDADDVAQPNRLAKQVEYLLKHPQCAVLGSSAEIINKEGQVVGQKLTKVSHPDIYKQYLIFHPMIHPTIMMRRSKLLFTDRIYRTDLNSNNDYLTFATMICTGKQFHNLPYKLLKYRMHGANDSLAQVKRTFLNSLKVRKIMVIEYRYQPQLINVLKLMAQVMIVAVLPEKIVFNLYLLMRGIITPRQMISNSVSVVKEKINMTWNYKLILPKA
jgi:glycosyltransferase involved in cell wall biosynthesis